MSDVGSLVRDLELITAAAHAAGELALRYKAQGLTTTFKPGNSPVTDADLAADALLTATLRAERPDYGWLSEETADNADRLACRRVFVVDPIDGTRAYAAGKPWWVVSIAVVEDGQPVAGCLYAPDLDETFTALIGLGAHLNGSPIRASDRSDLEGCGMVGDTAMFRHPGWPRPWPDMRVESRNATAYRLALVASGAFDATIALAPKADWDLAAADLIAREAGAHVTDHKGRPFAYNRPLPWQRSLVGCNPGLAALILDRTSLIDLPNATR